MADISAVILPLSKALQKQNCDLMKGISMVQDIKNMLALKRENAEAEFQLIFTQTCDLAKEMDVEISLPRRVGQQTQRANYSTTSSEEYFRRD